jgi:DNA-binding Lrp family transcriptional regulator
MNRNQFSRWRSYQKTLMAYYWLSDEDGLLCYATWAELSAEIGLSKDTVKRYAAEIERAHVIRVSPIINKGYPRTVVLMDHIKAAEYLASQEALLASRARDKETETYEYENCEDYASWDDESKEMLPREVTSSGKELSQPILNSDKQLILSIIQRLTEPNGMRSYSSIAEIAIETGLSKSKIFRCINVLSKQNIIARAAIPDRDPRRRPLVLLSHPAAIDYLKKNEKYWGPLSDQIELNREREKEKSKGKPSTPVAENSTNYAPG